MRVSSWVTVFGVGAIALAGACVDTTSPDPTLRSLSGTYVVQSVDGMPMPVLQVDYGTTRWYLLADTLWADGNGHYSRTTVFETDSVGRPYRAFQRGTLSGTYAIRGDTVALDSYCPPNALCVAPPVGWRVSDSEWMIGQRVTTGFASVSRFLRVQ